MEGTFFTYNYIPAGCVVIDLDQHPLLPRILEFVGDRQWRFFTRKSDNLAEPLKLPTELQDILLKTPNLVPFTTLWTQGWIQLAYATQPASSSLRSHGRVRVYVLPQDVNRGIHIPLSELTRSMPALLRHLDYSRGCWQGEDVFSSLSLPIHAGPAMSGNSDDSLLTLFNNIPSPDPHPDKASNTDLRWAMQCLLESQIPGLLTTLYPYQGRSAALST